MNDFTSKRYKNLVEVLLSKGLIDQAKAEEVNLRRLKTGEQEEEIIRSMRLVGEVDFVKAKAELLRIPFVDLEAIGFSPEALALVPESVADKYKVFPYKLDTKNKVIYVAMVNPLDLETIEFLEKRTNLKVESAVATEKQVSGFIKEKYIREKGITSEVTKAVEERKAEEVEAKEAAKGVTAEGSVSKIVSTILE